jgi:hypothetical protein
MRAVNLAAVRALMASRRTPEGSAAGGALPLAHTPRQRASPAEGIGETPICVLINGAAETYKAQGGKTVA